MKPEITIVPEGGLCNRMRAVGSALALARMANAGLRIIWYRTPDFNASFERLLSIESDTVPVKVEEKSAMSHLAKLGIRLKETLQRMRRMPTHLPGDTGSGFDASAFIAQASQRATYVRTHSRLIEEPGMFGCFRPVGVPADKLAKLSKIGPSTVGVHIRRTDNVKAIEKSPLSSFIDLMNAELASDSSTQFFLASDSIEVVSELRGRFGDRVSLYEKRAYSRDDPAAIEDAVVDLFGLAGCRKLIGSYWSSFTDTAHEIRQIDYVIAGSDA